MNNMEPTYSEYLAYQGELDEDTFFKKLPEATAYVDSLIYPNVPTEGNLIPYKQAICAVITHKVEYPHGSVSHYSAGKVSETYASVETPEEEARLYLSGTGLLCRWL